MTTTKTNLRQDTRGQAYVEYLTLFALVGIVTALALSRVAPGVVRAYSQQRQNLYNPAP